MLDWVLSIIILTKYPKRLIDKLWKPCQIQGMKNSCNFRLKRLKISRPNQNYLKTATSYLESASVVGLVLTLSVQTLCVLIGVTCKKSYASLLIDDAVHLPVVRLRSQQLHRANKRVGKMKLMVLFVIMLLILEAVKGMSANLTSWRQHRRQKRFLIYQNGGVVKLVTGCAFPVDLRDKKAWRQLVWLMNFHYQFNEPQTPIYWWNLWNSSNSGRNLKKSNLIPSAPVKPMMVDEPQLLLFKFAESYMNRIGQNGTACLERHICENGQVHEHSGLYAQLLHRLLRPHKSLDARFVDAYRMGKHGVNCRKVYPEAVHCLLDDYVHVHERGLTQSFL